MATFKITLTETRVAEVEAETMAQALEDFNPEYDGRQLPNKITLEEI